MNNLRFYKIFDWILVSLSYIAAILLYQGGLLYNKNQDTVAVFNYLRVSGLILYTVLLTLQIVVYIMGIVNAVTTKQSMSKHNMIVKLVSIPFFVINWIGLFSLSCDSVSIHPLFIFVVGFLSFLGTFLIMFRTSFPEIIYFIKSYIKKTLKPTPWAIIALIFLFVFCLDAIGEIILFNHERNQRLDIAVRIKAERFKKIDEWKTDKHKSLHSFRIKSIILTSLLSITSILIVVVLSVEAKNVVQINTEELGSLIKTPFFVASVIAVLILSFVKFMSGIRYGKCGEDDPTSFLFILKMADMVPVIALLAIVVFFWIIGTALGGFAVLLILCIVVVIIVFVIMSLLALGMVSYASSIPFMMAALFCIWGTSLCAFTYFVNQRYMKNRRFKNPFIIVCLICLFVPVLDIAALVILKNESKNNSILSDKPVITRD